MRYEHHQSTDTSVLVILLKTVKISTQCFGYLKRTIPLQQRKIQGSRLLFYEVIKSCVTKSMLFILPEFQVLSISILFWSPILTSLELITLICVPMFSACMLDPETFIVGCSHVGSKKSRNIIIHYGLHVQAISLSHKVHIYHVCQRSPGT